MDDAKGNRLQLIFRGVAGINPEEPALLAYATPYCFYSATTESIRNTVIDETTSLPLRSCHMGQTSY